MRIPHCPCPVRFHQATAAARAALSFCALGSNCFCAGFEPLFGLCAATLPTATTTTSQPRDALRNYTGNEPCILLCSSCYVHCAASSVEMMWPRGRNVGGDPSDFLQNAKTWLCMAAALPPRQQHRNAWVHYKDYKGFGACSSSCSSYYMCVRISPPSVCKGVATRSKRRRRTLWTSERQDLALYGGLPTTTTTTSRCRSALQRPHGLGALLSTMLLMLCAYRHAVCT